MTGPAAALLQCVATDSFLNTALTVGPCAMADSTTAAGTLSVAVGIAAYLAYLVTGNLSWVDRSWSITPVVYTWIYVAYDGSALATDGFVTGRALFAAVITMWGLRLTYNYWRRGGYDRGFEDHRWEHVRKMIDQDDAVLWHSFVLGVVSLLQSVLLWLITAPVLALPARTAASGADVTFAALAAVWLLVEATADQQQWAFQNEKRDLRPRRKVLQGDYERGFLSHGLFALSRHPNLFSEQMIWLSVYGASIRTMGLFNCTLAGWVVLILLTVRGCLLQESITAPKYPTYRAYQRTVPMLIPAGGTRRPLPPDDATASPAGRDVALSQSPAR